MPDQRGELWGASDAYEAYMGRWSRRIAPQFLSWLAPKVNSSWIDVGCGTGVLCQSIVAGFQPKSVLGVDPSSKFIETAHTRIQDECFDGQVGNAGSLDCPDETFDYAVSGLVLNFVPDKARAVEEMVRVVKHGGKCGLYVWDYGGNMQIMRRFFDAALERDQSARDFDDGFDDTTCRPAPLRQEFETAGLMDVTVEAIDIPTPFANFEDYWAPFLGGTGSAPKYLATLSPDQQAELKEAVRGRIPTGPDGEILLAARAWAVQGTRQ